MKRSSKMDLDNYKSVAQSNMINSKSVIGEPVKSSLRILFCCKLERSPLVTVANQIITLFILIVDLVHWILIGALTFDFNMVGIADPGHQLALRYKSRWSWSRDLRSIRGVIVQP